LEACSGVGGILKVAAAITGYRNRLWFVGAVWWSRHLRALVGITGVSSTVTGEGAGSLEERTGCGATIVAE